MYDRKKYGDRIRQLRIQNEYTQEELAEKLGLSSAYLGDLERYKGTPSLPVFCKAMRTLNFSADDYVYPNGNTNNTTYKQLQRLLTHCDEHQLQVLLATVTALLKPVQEPNNKNTE